MPDDKVIPCDCGYEVTATDETALLEDIRRHALDAHGIAFSVEDALLVVLCSELDLDLDLSRAPSEAGTCRRGVPEGGST